MTPGHDGRRAQAPGPPARFDVLGVEVSAVDMTGALDVVTAWVDGGVRQYVCVTGVHGVMESRRDPALRRIHNGAGLVTPDGMPLVWCAHSLGLDSVERVYGPDLMLAICERAAARGWSAFFYGGAPGTPERLAASLERRFPGLRVAGTHSPPYRPLTPEEDAELVDRINATAPDLVWVGLSTPKQERWMADHVGRLEASVLLGVGAAFDIHAGLRPQAPRWMQRNGLEWLYRLGVEPRRLWRRYLVNNPRFVWSIMRERPALVASPSPAAGTGSPA